MPFDRLAPGAISRLSGARNYRPRQFAHAPLRVAGGALPVQQFTADRRGLREALVAEIGGQARQASSRSDFRPLALDEPFGPWEGRAEFLFQIRGYAATRALISRLATLCPSSSGRLLLTDSRPITRHSTFVGNIDFKRRRNIEPSQVGSRQRSRSNSRYTVRSLALKSMPALIA